MDTLNVSAIYMEDLFNDMYEKNEEEQVKKRE